MDTNIIGLMIYVFILGTLWAIYSTYKHLPYWIDAIAGIITAVIGY